MVFLPSNDWSYLDPPMMVPRWDTYVGTTPMLYTNAFHTSWSYFNAHIHAHFRHIGWKLSNRQIGYNWTTSPHI
jgi:hypothetical protein